jgi:hypothetical protein
MLSAFAERGEYSVDSNWSQRWGQQRIVPCYRQNIGQVLRDNGLSEYDEFSLLMLSKGRYEQDDFYLEEVPTDPVPDLLSRRSQTKVTEVVPMESPRLLVFFRDGLSKVIDVQALVFLPAGPSWSPRTASTRWGSSRTGTGSTGMTRPILLTVPCTRKDLNRYAQTHLTRPHTI